MDEPRIFSTDGDGIDTLTFDAFGTPAPFVGADLLIGPNEAFPTNEALSSMTDEEFDRIPECQCVAAVLDPWSRSEHWIPSRNEVPASEEWSEEREAAFRAAVRTEAVKRGATHILWHVGITRSETEPLPPPVSGGDHDQDGACSNCGCRPCHCLGGLDWTPERAHAYDQDGAEEQAILRELLDVGPEWTDVSEEAQHWIARNAQREAAAVAPPTDE